MTSDRNLLSLQCPFCGHKHSDDYECLDDGHVDLLRCQNQACGRQFSFLIYECLECGGECVFTWKNTPPSETLALLSCNHCGAPFDETASEGQKPNPPKRI